MTRGWSRKHLASEAGVDEATVKRLETDYPRSQEPSARRVQMLLGM